MISLESSRETVIELEDLFCEFSAHFHFYQFMRKML